LQDKHFEVDDFKNKLSVANQGLKNKEEQYANLED